MLDTLSRPVRDLRISVTDRCNFRCTYCMPREVFGREYPFVPRSEVLTYEELSLLAEAFANLGVTKVRLTGGEPLLRRDLARLVERVARVAGIDDIALTTNGSLLTADLAADLRNAGLRRITISLDAINPAVFRTMSDTHIAVGRVLEAIDIAAAAGLSPVKIDAVIRRAENESEVLPLARHFRGTPHILRFIEYMDVGSSNAWRRDQVVSAAEILSAIQAEWPIEPLPSQYRGEVAARWRYADGQGEIGVISSVSQPFCGDCTRARITANGQMYLCLFASAGHDLRALLRSGASVEQITDRIGGIWRGRNDRYSELREKTSRSGPRVEMSRIGG